MRKINLRGVSLDYSEDFEQTVTRRLLSYWRDNRKADTGHLHWPDVNLMDLYDVAPLLCVKDKIETDGEVEYCNRYWGTTLTQVFGFDGTNMKLCGYYGTQDLADGINTLKDVLDSPLPLRERGNLVVAADKAYIEFERINLPMTNLAGQFMHVITVTAFFHMNGKAY